jgi:hypothetical protein
MLEKKYKDAKKKASALTKEVDALKTWGEEKRRLEGKLWEVDREVRGRGEPHIYGGVDFSAIYGKQGKVERSNGAVALGMGGRKTVRIHRTGSIEVENYKEVGDALEEMGEEEETEVLEGRNDREMKPEELREGF